MNHRINEDLAAQYGNIHVFSIHQPAQVWIVVMVSHSIHPLVVLV